MELPEEIIRNHIVTLVPWEFTRVNKFYRTLIIYHIYPNTANYGMYVLKLLSRYIDAFIKAINNFPYFIYALREPLMKIAVTNYKKLSPDVLVIIQKTMFVEEGPLVNLCKYALLCDADERVIGSRVALERRLREEAYFDSQIFTPEPDPTNGIVIEYTRKYCPNLLVAYLHACNGLDCPINNSADCMNRVLMIKEIRDSVNEEVVMGAALSAHRELTAGNGFVLIDTIKYREKAPKVFNLLRDENSNTIEKRTFNRAMAQIRNSMIFNTIVDKWTKALCVARRVVHGEDDHVSAWFLNVDEDVDEGNDEEVEND